MTAASKRKTTNRQDVSPYIWLGIIALVIFSGSGFTFFSARTSDHDFNETVNGAERAEVQLDLNAGALTIMTTSERDTLFAAQIENTRSQPDLDVSGGDEREINLGSRSRGGFNFFGSNNERWDVQLNENIPTALEIDSGAGQVTADLSALTLIELEVDSGAGNITLDLPATGDEYPVTLNGGAGNVTINMADEAEIDLEVDTGAGNVTLAFGRGTDAAVKIDAGVGNVTLDIPENAAVRLDVDTGVGNINVPSGFVRDGDVYVTENYDDADTRIEVEFDGGAGNLNVN